MANAIQQSSVQSLFLTMKFNDTEIATGTGFVVNSKIGSLLLTNRHNFTGKNNETSELLSKTGAIPNKITICHNKKNELGKWIIKEENILDEDRPLWFEHPTLKEKADFIALKLTNLSDVEIYAYDLISTGPQIACQVTDLVSVVGFPFGLQYGGSLGIWATGFIASEMDINFSERPVFLIDCRSRQGQSGSPVIAHRNGGMVPMQDGGSSVFTGAITKFLGIYSGRINNESDLGLVWKASALSELIISIENVNPPNHSNSSA